MPTRKQSLEVSKVYHVFSKSIAGFKVFNNYFEFSRMVNILRYYRRENPTTRFSMFVNLLETGRKDLARDISNTKRDELVDIVAYCIMPTHFHLILKQLKENGISEFMRKILNSHSRYFNTKHKRNGPLWESRFRNVLVETDEQLIHLTRYIHLNPVTAHLVDKPQDWRYSSYQEFLGKVEEKQSICNYSSLLDIDAQDYEKFVHFQIDYQRELAEIKKLFLE